MHAPARRIDLGSRAARPSLPPSVGIRGNPHFPMSDLNNVEIANHLSEFLRNKGLD